MKRVKFASRFSPVRRKFDIPGFGRLCRFSSSKSFGSLTIFILGCDDGSPNCIRSVHDRLLALFVEAKLRGRRSAPK